MEIWVWWRRMSPAVRLYLASAAVFGLSSGMFDLFFNLYLLDTGHTADEVGTLSFVGMAVMALGAIPLGLLADRLGSRWFLVGGSLLYGVALIALPWSAKMPVLALLTGLTYLGSAARQTTEFPVLAGAVELAHRTTMFSLYFICFLIGSGLGALLGGPLMHVLPHGPLSVYQVPLLVAGGLGAVAGVLRLFLPLKGEVRSQALRARTSFLPTGRMLQVAVVGWLAGGSFVLTFRLLNVVLQARYAVGPEQISLLMGLTTLFCLGGAVAAPALARLLGPPRAAVLVMALTLVFLIAAGLSPLVPLFILPVIIRQALHYAQLPLLETLAMQSVGPPQRSTMASYRQTGLFLGMAMAAKLYGRLISGGQFPTAFLVSGLFAALAGVGYYLFFGRQHSELPVNTD